MIGSFMDESFDEQPRGVFAVGGLMGRGVAMFELERRWEELRTRPDIDIKYFKASECKHGTGEFAKFVETPRSPTQNERGRLDSIGQEFLTAIVDPPFDKNYLVLGGVGVVQEDFYDVIKDPKARAVLGENPYRLAYDFALIQCAWAMKELGTGDSVSFVCDEHEQYGPLASEAYRQLKADNPHASTFMGTYSSADDRTCETLQAADAVIFEIRCALNLALGNWKGQLRKQFNLLTDSRAMFLITHSKKEQLLHIVARHKPGEPFKLDELMEMHLDQDLKIVL